MTNNFLTGVLTIKDAIKGGFVIAESIISVIPICDKIIINDAGSTDGTLELFYRLKNMWPEKVEILQIPDSDYPTKHFEIVDDVVNKYILPKITSDWIISLEGDTIWHENNIFKLLDVMKTTSSNSIRQPNWDVQWCTKKAFKEFYTVRIARNLPGIFMCDGGGGFGVYGKRYSSNEKYSMSGIEPEVVVNYPRFHFPYLFPGNLVERAKRHAEILETGNKEREEYYLELKKKYKDTIFEKQDVKPSANLPTLVKGLAGEPYYYVREELFDKEWLKNVTGLNYDTY